MQEFDKIHKVYEIFLMVFKNPIRILTIIAFVIVFKSFRTLHKTINQ